MDLTPKMTNKVTTYEELNTDDKYAEDDFTTPSKKLSKVKQAISCSLKNIFHTNIKTII